MGAVYIEWECDEEGCRETVEMKTASEFGGSIPESHRWTPPGMRWMSLDREHQPLGKVLCEKHAQRALDAFNKANPGAVWVA